MQRQAGFTLIELMITMVVLAILAAIAIPSYTDYVLRGKIPEATTALQTQKTKMEQFFQDNRVYPTGCTTGAPAAGQIQIPTLQYFTITCPAPLLTATTYTIVATGSIPDLTGVQYTINQSNARTTTVTAGTAMTKHGYAPGTVNCWVSRKPNLC